MPSGRRLEALVRQFDRELSRLERSAIVRLDGALRVAAANLERELRRYYLVALDDAAMTSSMLMREARARALLAQVQGALDLTTGANANQVFGQLIGDSFDLGSRNALDALSLFQQDLVSLSSGARLNVAARATQTSARLAHHGQAFALKTEELVIDGIVRGRGWSATAREVRREVGTTRWKAEQLVRTESISASHDARADTYRENGVEYGTWISTLDSVLCLFCAARSGQHYKVDDVVIPAHPGCRCYLQPYRPHWAELGLVDEEWNAAHRKDALDRAMTTPTGRKRKPVGNAPSPFERAAGRTSAPTPLGG